MVVDFHTHIFPDSIAKKSMEYLEEQGGIKARTDGTLDGLKRSMQENNIDISVALPVVTKPSHFEKVNQFAASINKKEGIISFGGIHPDTKDYKVDLDRIKSMGLQGIKLHPDYQNTYVDDQKMIQIIRYAAELGLIVLLHAGIDIGLPEPVYCPPRRAANMLSLLDNTDAKIILAHTGGYRQWDEVEEYIVGMNVWLDISYSLNHISDEQFVRIVKDHGADRVLFASDSPWESPGQTYRMLMQLDFSQEEFDRILYRNAMELLGMDGNG